MGNIIIGKHTLESLTSGMYSEPYVVFREYIQNAADSIDDAIRAGVLAPEQGEIKIDFSAIERRIIIKDNGMGIDSNSVEKTLISIGNSKKLSGVSRGFRGIGRLSGLSYCSALTFETSFRSEKIGTRVKIDASRLVQLLSAEEGTDASAIDVLNKVYSIESFKEKENAHYFNVYMDGVDESFGLNNYESIITYIEQNAPVSYNPATFKWGKEIANRIYAAGYHIHSYNISASYGGKSITIFKPYKDTFRVDKSGSLTDKINDIEVFSVSQADGETLAIGWLAKTNYLGSIYDKAIKGVRLRKGNMLIGDGQTLNAIFKDARFNGWSVGEVFVISDKLIPNARRDNLEKNPSYFSLLEQLATKAGTIVRDIRSASLARNAELSAALEKTQTAVRVANEAIIDGVGGRGKEVITAALSNARSSVSGIAIADDTSAYYQEIAFDELDMLIGKLQGATSFKAINLLSGLRKEEKIVLERVFGTLLLALGNEADSIIELLANEFAGKKDIYEPDRVEKQR